MMLHDKYLPDFDFFEVHTLPVCASPPEIAAAIRALRFTASPTIRFLLRIRGTSPRDVNGVSNLQRMGFVELESVPDREVIFGLVGQFWKSDGNIQPIQNADEFLAFDSPGFLKATWNFLITPSNSTCCELRTETRIRCIGKNARQKFAWYWFVIKPFSGLIRMEMLRAIRRDAE